MEHLSELLYNLAPYTHFIAFGLLILAGLNIPVSEDLVFIIAASIAATITPENTMLIFLGCFAGAYTSDIIAYTIGRYAGRQVIETKIIRRFVSEMKILKVEEYFHHYGQKTLFFGRFIPFGVRNVLFISAGIARMRFHRFLIIDFFALIITSTILFSLGFFFGENYRLIEPYLDRYKYVVFTIFIVIVTLVITIEIKSLKDPKDINDQL